MATLRRDSGCDFDCGYYDMDANDYYHEWCSHPDAEEVLTETGDDFVAICPLTGKALNEE